MKTRSILLSFLLLVPLYSCHKGDEIHFTLYLENTGSFPNCRTFKLTVDGIDILTKQVCAAGASPNVSAFLFEIKAGNHEIKVEIIEDSIVFEQVVDFDDSQKFGYLTYNNNSSEITFILDSRGGLP